MAARTHGPELAPLDDETIARIAQADVELPVDDIDAVESEADIDWEDDDDEDDFTTAPEQKGTLNRVESFFATITSPGKNHAAASRKVSDIRESPRPVSTATASTSPNNPGRSGGQQNATRTARLTSAAPPPPQPSRRKDRAPAPAREQSGVAGNPAVTEQEAALASAEPLLAMLPLSFKLGVRFVHSAFAHLLEQLLEQGEAGMKPMTDLLLKRNAAAQSLGRIAAGGAYSAAGGQWFPGKNLAISKLEQVRAVM